MQFFLYLAAYSGQREAWQRTFRVGYRCVLLSFRVSSHLLQQVSCSLEHAKYLYNRGTSAVDDDVRCAWHDKFKKTCRPCSLKSHLMQVHRIVRLVRGSASCVMFCG